MISFPFKGRHLLAILIIIIIIFAPNLHAAISIHYLSFRTSQWSRKPWKPFLQAFLREQFRKNKELVPRIELQCSVKGFPFHRWCSVFDYIDTDFLKYFLFKNIFKFIFNIYVSKQFMIIKYLKYFFKYKNNHSLIDGFDFYFVGL